MKHRKIKPRNPIVQQMIEDNHLRPKRVESPKYNRNRVSPRRLAREVYNEHVLEEDFDMVGKQPPMKGSKTNED